MANSKKRISELPALNVASLDTTFVLGISGSTTYKISINNLTSSLDTTFATDLVTNALSSSLNSKLSTSSFNSYTASAINGTISGSSQLTSSFDQRYVLSGSITQTTWDNIANKPSGIVSQSTDLSSLNTFTASISTASLVTSIDNLNTFTASQSTSSLVNRLNAIESVSGSWITESETGSFLTSLSGAISSSTQISDLGFVTGSYTTINSFNSLTQSFNSISQSFNVISGSVGTIDFSGINAVTASYLAFTQSFNTYTASISTASLVTSISNLNTFTASQSTSSLVNRLNAIENVSGSWITESETGSLQTSITNLNTFTASVSTASLVTSISNLNSATSSYLTSLSGAISSSSQLTSSFDTRYVASGSISAVPAGTISGSSQLTSSYDTRYVASGSISATPSGTISGSSQLTSSFDLRYLVTGSVTSSINALNTATSSYETKGRSIVSGSSQLTSSYDGRYTQTGSFNTFTSSINSWTSSFSSSLTSSITSVSGTFTNLTVNGQPTTYGYVNGAYLLAQNTTDQSVGLNEAVNFQTTIASNGSIITKTSNSQVTLTAGNTYKLEGIIRRLTSNSTWAAFRWYDVTNSAYVGIEGFSETTNSSGAISSTNVATYIVTPTVNTIYELRQTTVNTISVSGGYAGYEITQLNPSIAIQATATGTTSTNFIKYTRSSQQTSLSNGSVIVCNVLENSSGNVISPNTSTGQITLTAGKTYRLKGMVPGFTTSGGDVRPQFCWYNETTAAYIGSSAAAYSANSVASYGAFGGAAEAIITPNATTIVSFRVLAGATNVSGIGGNADFSTTGSYPWIDIEEIGSTFALNTLATMQISNSLAVTGSTTLKGAVTIGTGSGYEGGEISLAYAQGGSTTLTGSAIAFDVYGDKIRIFEGGGTNRGGYFDISTLAAGVGTDLGKITYLIEAYANASYTLPGSYTSDVCRYSVVSTNVNVPTAWFNTSTYTFTPLKAGYWEIRASYDVYRNGEGSLIIQKNGTSVAQAGSISAVVQQVTKIIYMNGSTDYINVYNSGINSNARTQTAANAFFQARYVGA